MNTLLQTNLISGLGRFNVPRRSPPRLRVQRSRKDSLQIYRQTPTLQPIRKSPRWLYINNLVIIPPSTSPYPPFPIIILTMPSDLATTTSLAPIARPGYWAYAGVSRTLNVTYIRPIPEGETVLVESEVVHAGKRLCSLSGVMKRERDGAVMATCEHGKGEVN